jgi:hypothetical protein
MESIEIGKIKISGSMQTNRVWVQLSWELRSKILHKFIHIKHIMSSKKLAAFVWRLSPFRKPFSSHFPDDAKIVRVPQSPAMAVHTNQAALLTETGALLTWNEGKGQMGDVQSVVDQLGIPSDIVNGQLSVKQIALGNKKLVLVGDDGL